ncbi:MAG: dependent oxidoreductase [Gemmatimonadetes bacterium]|nr:dependent oxidoreductase [Gemmatimonadota bacterium]
MKRRDFLVGLGAAASTAATGGLSAAIVGCAPKTDRALGGGFVDDGGARGHRLRDRMPMPAPRRTVRVPVVVIGGGMAGLSAAWWLQRAGMRDFVVLELEDHAGGNARWGENEVSRYPWAAHYVPVPGPRAVHVRELFAEMGVLRPDGSWDERMLCFAPQERVFAQGRWREGLEATLALSSGGVEEAKRFRGHVDRFHASGEFTIPSALGRRPSPLDALPFGEWLRREGFRSPAFLWYMEYGCRDDYGALPADTSAWAGIHYHASRDADPGPLTWPEGNGHITRHLLSRVGDRVHTGAPVHRVERAGPGVRVLAGDTEYLADAAVWAAPSFLASRLVEGAPAVDFTYSPWLTANLTLDRLPRESGFPLSWDNVLLHSQALGYVDATHQSIATREDRSVWTYYWALAHQPPRQARETLLRRPWGAWAELILADLERAHPDIRRCVSRVDVMRMGHAMVRPTPGFLASPARAALASAAGPVFYAHSDLSGLSLFEEAQHGGITAAERVLARLGGRSPAAVPTAQGATAR